MEPERSVMIDAVIFDMDGVLVDSEPIHFATTNEVLGRRGASIARDDYDRCTGMDERAFFGLLVERLSLDEPVERLVRERLAASLERMSSDPLPPTEGAPECLLALRADGRRVALASSSTRAQVELVVGRLGMGRLLDAAVSIDDVDRGKPAPDLFVEAARRIGVEPARCLVVEDAELGVQAARAAGMRAVALVSPDRSDEPHRRAGALTTIASLAELTVDAVESWGAEPR